MMRGRFRTQRHRATDMSFGILAECAQGRAGATSSLPAPCYAKNSRPAMRTEYIPLFVFGLIVAAAPAVAFALARRVGPVDANSAHHVSNPGEPLAFEETERRSNSSQIYLVGALFVICDILMIFLVPWAVRMTALGLFGLAQVLRSWAFWPADTFGCTEIGLWSGPSGFPPQVAG